MKRANKTKHNSIGKLLNVSRYTGGGLTPLVTADNRMIRRMRGERKKDMSEIGYIYMIGKCEDKLRELMGAEEYSKFAAEIARGAFKAEIDSMAASDFKDFLQSHFDELTADDYNPENFDA